MNSISEEIIFVVQQIEFVANTTLEVIRYEPVSSSTADGKIHMYSIATCDMYVIHRWEKSDPNF